jgi:hypothetical protein
LLCLSPEYDNAFEESCSKDRVEEVALTKEAEQRQVLGSRASRRREKRPEDRPAYYLARIKMITAGLTSEMKFAPGNAGGCFHPDAGTPARFLRHQADCGPGIVCIQ